MTTRFKALTNSLCASVAASGAAALLIAIPLAGTSKAAEVLIAPLTSGSCAQGASGTVSFLHSSITSIFGAGDTPICYNGDKKYSFASTSNLSGDDIFQISTNGQIHDLQINAGGNGFFVPGQYAADYTVDIWTGDNVFLSYSTGATTPIPGVTWTKDLQAVGYAAAEAQETTQGGTSQFVNVLPVTQLIFSGVPGVAGSDWVVFGAPVIDGIPAGLTQVVDSAIQTTPRTRVPGPLPILGAAAAFGYSRRLRRAISIRANA